MRCPPLPLPPEWSEGEEIVYAFSVTSYSFLHVREGLCYAEDEQGGNRTRTDWPQTTKDQSTNRTRCATPVSDRDTYAGLCSINFA
jgi:hypothetical protein